MQATLTVLGSGTSMGVPTVGCDCKVCRSADPHDRRTRPSIMLEWDGHRVLIDTTPDFREQALREGIDRIDAVLYTHGHADHILGLDDLRPLTFPRITGGPKLPLYANAPTMAVLRQVFKYIFDADYKFGGLAQVDLIEVTGPVEVKGVTFTPVTVIHGEAPIIGYRMGSAAYLTDFSEIPAESMRQLQGLDVLFLDALRHHPHPTHSTIERSLGIVEELRPRRAFFTHISHDLPHHETNAVLPPHVRLAHDGLRLQFEI
jgi:phosphoribosyl 1,2-cyclic phosphate phosphodiesterase